jgi:hypothetical protein
MKTFNTTLWVQNLNDIYQQALTAQPVKPFFLVVYDYVDYVLTTDTLAQLSDIFWVHKKTDYEALEQYKKELIDWIKKLIPNLKKIPSDNAEIKDELKHIQGILEGRTQVLGDPEGWESIYSGFEHIVAVAIREKTSAKDILPRLGVEKYTDEHRVTQWKGQDIYEKYHIEKDKVERLQQTRGWYAWQHLKIFYEVFKDYEGMRQDVAKNNNVWELSNLSQLIEELKAVLKNVTTDQIVVFRHENYLPFLQKAHRQLLSEIATFEDVSKEVEQEITPTQTIPFIFDEQNATVGINKETIKFQKETRKFEFLKKLISQPEGIYYAEDVAELEGAIKGKSLKDTYYDTCRGIQTSFLKVGVTNFLIFNYTKAQINPLYKKE